MSPKPDKVRYLEGRWLRRRKDNDKTYDIFWRKDSVMSDVQTKIYYKEDYPL
jgi:hypothetical protein